MSTMRVWLLSLLLVLGLLPLAAPARADEVADLVSRLEAAGAKVVRVGADDARLRGEGRVTTAVVNGKVEVYLPEGGVRTPLRTPTERLTVEEFRQLSGEIRAAVRELYGIEVERVYIAGSSSGIPFRDPNSGELRTFDRKGARTSDYDGALVSPELFAKVAADAPRTVRGGTTGRRTSPDPLPALRQKFHEIGERWGRKVAAMVYASDAEFRKRMQLTGLEVGSNVMPEPAPGAKAVEVTRAELLGALIEVEQLKRLLAAPGGAGAQQAEALLERARQGDLAAQEELRRLRSEASRAVRDRSGDLGETERGLLNNEVKRLEGSSNFALPRAGRTDGPLVVNEAEAREVFERVREGAALRAAERGAAAPERERAAVRDGVDRVREAGLEVVRSPMLLAEYSPETNSVRVSEGVLDALLRVHPGAAGAEMRRKALGLIFGHELGHAAGLRAEGVADAEAVRAVERAPGLLTTPLTPADARSTLELFTRGGGRLSDALNALRGLALYGTPGGRLDGMTRAIEGIPDPLSRFRRTDGTIDWRRLSADRARAHAAGVTHFALGLFLKELAVVVRTGDRLRIDEFFDGLCTTDFFVEYGLFSAGARMGDVAYGRFLARHVKPRFVSGVLRTNIALATGMALPALVRGELDGRAFVIDVAALGLSSVAVKAGLAGLEWVVDLRKAEAAGLLARATQLRHLARLGGFFYTAAETAVVLYLGDELSRAATAWLDERAIKGLIAERTRALLDAARDPSTSPARLRELTESLAAAHVAWRDSLLRPVAEAEALYHSRVVRAARAAKLVADRRTAARERIEAQPALRDSIVARAGSIDAYLADLGKDDEARIERDLTEAMTILERARADGLRRAYAADARRSSTYLPAGARDTGGLFGFYGRMRLESEARDLSENRLQAYDDEVRALDLARGLVTDPARRAALDDAIALTREVARRDAALLGAAAGLPAAPTPGLRGAVDPRRP